MGCVSMKEASNSMIGERYHSYISQQKILVFRFKAGKVPGSEYELRHGSTKTRVDRDPRTGRIRVQQQNVGRDVSSILMSILTIFFVLLAVAYIGTARQEALTATAHTISGAVRDTVVFLYMYAIVPSFFLLAAVAVVLSVYFGHKKWKHLKEQEEAAFYDLVDKILGKFFLYETTTTWNLSLLKILQSHHRGGTSG
ncbi:unnamed protein product [Strongylus vulgaris]|uniref:Uncharacterized protein n=1 Tax=Strongylus vulgaris TaxID=40348 RepID=A0A3P7IY55_STRVU|nr:unnamed protein product [Strongylus vulgaris]